MSWLGHSTLLLEVDGSTRLTDPVLRNRIGPLVRIARSEHLLVPSELDGVLLSHLHADHTDLPSLRRLAHARSVLAPAPAAHWLKKGSSLVG